MAAVFLKLLEIALHLCWRKKEVALQRIGIGHPHAHAVVSLGLFRKDGVYFPMEDLDFSGLEELFRERFFRMLLRREKILPETVEILKAGPTLVSMSGGSGKSRPRTGRDSRASSPTLRDPL